jgi:tetratricopeptide (TPR) repeat protein
MAEASSLRPTCASDSPESIAAAAEEVERSAIVDLEAALRAGTALVERADRLGQPRARARARRAAAAALTYANRFDDALRLLRESEALAAADAVEAAEARMGMLHALARLGRLDEALAAGQAASATFRERGRALSAARAEINLGVIERMRNDPARALVLFDAARPDVAEHPRILAQLDSNRAEALLDLGQFEGAEASFEAALRSFQAAGMSRAAAIVEGNLGDLMSRQGRSERALAHFERARRAFELDRAQGDLARIQAEQAEAFVGAGLREAAAESYAQALGELDRHGLVLEAARARTGMARVAVQSGHHALAESELARAARCLEPMTQRAALGRVRLVQGELALARGDGDAEARFSAALDLLDDRPAEAAQARHQLAGLALDGGRLEQAESLIARALAGARRMNLAPLLADLLHRRAGLRRRQGRPAEHVDDLRAAVAEIERIRGSHQAERLRAASAGERARVYEDLVQALLDEEAPGRVGEAFHVAEQSRCRSLLDLVAGAIDGALPAQPGPGDRGDGLVAEAIALRRQINALYSRVWDTGGSDPASWREALEERERRLHVVEMRLASVGQGVAGVLAAPAGLRDVQPLLEPGTRLIEYLIAGDEVLAFVVGSDRAGAVRRLTSAALLREQIELLHFEIGRAMGYPAAELGPDSAPLRHARQVLETLHAALIRPLEPELPGARRLIVVPHGALHALPFNALWDGRRHLIERFEVTMAPSASLLRQLPAPRPGGTPLVVGVPDEAAPHIQTEARHVARLLGATLLLEREATVARVTREAAGAPVIHLACHGRFLPQRPLSSGLRLADGWLTARDLYGLRLDGAAVVLSACDTGAQAVGDGDDVMGLVSGFCAAGASSLVLSLWALNDEIASRTMVELHRTWHNGAGPGGWAYRLRSIQLEVMRANPHPLFWAPCILVGR